MHTVLKCNECSQHLSETPDAGSSANDGDLEIEPFQLSMHSEKAITGGAHHGRWKNTFKWPFKFVMFIKLTCQVLTSMTMGHGPWIRGFVNKKHYRIGNALMSFSWQV